MPLDETETRQPQRLRESLAASPDCDVAIAKRRRLALPDLEFVAIDGMNRSSMTAADSVPMCQQDTVVHRFCGGAIPGKDYTLREGEIHARYRDGTCDPPIVDWLSCSKGLSTALCTKENCVKVQAFLLHGMLWALRIGGVDKEEQLAEAINTEIDNVVVMRVLDLASEAAQSNPGLFPTLLQGRADISPHVRRDPYNPLAAELHEALLTYMYHCCERYASKRDPAIFADAFDAAGFVLDLELNELSYLSGSVLAPFSRRLAQLVQSVLDAKLGIAFTVSTFDNYKRCLGAM